MDTQIRKFGWLLAAGLLGAALVAPSAAFAIEGHQSGDNIAWDDAEFQGSEGECEDANLAPGQVLWHFVQTEVPSGVDSGNLSGTTSDGAFGPVASYKKSGPVLHWAVITGPTTLLTFQSDVDSEGVLNLSHICYGGETTTTTTSEEETTTTSEEETTTTSEEETTTTESTDEETTRTTSTGVEEEKTPPSTDTIGQSSTSTVSGALLLVFAGLISLALVVPASKVRSRR